MEYRFLPVVFSLFVIFIVTSAVWLPGQVWQPTFVASYEKNNAACSTEHYKFYHNVCDPKPEIPPMSRGLVQTVIACSAKCQLGNGCTAFLYAPGSGGGKGVCRIYNVRLTSVDTSCMGLIYGQLEMANCRPSWISACVNDVDCTGIRRMCRNGICTCESGYMFEPMSGNCVAECQEYGDTFSRAWVTFLETTDNITITNIMTYECAAECLKTDCRSYQYNVLEDTCVLSNLTVVTAEPNSTWYKWRNRLFQRECAFKL